MRPLFLHLHECVMNTQHHQLFHSLENLLIKSSLHLGVSTHALSLSFFFFFFFFFALTKIFVYFGKLNF